ncbi:MAG: undecaprenyl/decaprenyl-phosphate alpha-N-acetylglucosaminyl 1-phosphate transferase, partial [Thermoguttaceae bacterium]|nr:undecaprenyl/decaprenyl-phosphate alpha-N-acetylglucosaminyl 1-phosphate transferase [Thermoguttaceae bacterium]
MATLFAAVTMAAFVLSCAACGLIRRFAPVIGLVDKPGERKIHHTAMPTGGGLGIWLSVIVLALLGTILAGFITRAVPPDASGPVTFWGITLPEIITRRAPGVLFQARRFWVLLGLGTILVALGTIDDRRGLSWKLRLGVQTLVAAAAVAAGWEATFFLPIPWLTKILSVIWIVGLINSFNMLDNMDALSGGVAVICASFLAAVLLLFARNAESGEPQLFLGGFLLLLAGAILGFLVHNRPPARLFMGDGGAY